MENEAKKEELVTVLKAKLVKRMVNPSDLDKLDVFALYDSKLSIKQNLNALMQCDELSGIEWKQSKANVKARMAEMQARIASQERQELKNELLTVRKVGTSQLIDSVKCFLGTKDKALVVLGDGGLGKTTACLNAIRSSQTDFVLHNTHLTPASLFASLRASNDVLHVFDDVSGLWNDDGVVGILKGCADTLGIAQWEKLDKTGTPINVSVKFKGKIIILCNEISRLGNSSIQAVLDRTIIFEHYPTSRDVLDTAECSEKVKTDLLTGLTNNPFLRITYRSIAQLENAIKDEVEYRRRLSAITLNYADRLFNQLMDNDELGVSQKCKQWSNFTGKSARTFWNKYKQCTERIAVVCSSEPLTKTMEA